VQVKEFLILCGETPKFQRGLLNSRDDLWNIFKKEANGGDTKSGGQGRANQLRMRDHRGDAAWHVDAEFLFEQHRAGVGFADVALRADHGINRLVARLFRRLPRAFPGGNEFPIDELGHLRTKTRQFRLRLGRIGVDFEKQSEDAAVTHRSIYEYMAAPGPATQLGIEAQAQGGVPRANRTKRGLARR
jgi:hypothetical protein